MKICKNCGNEFPTSMIINGKRRWLNSRTYCLSCSPFGNHNTKCLDSTTVVQKLPIPCTCSSCKKNYLYIRGKGHSKSTCGSCFSTRNRKRIKEKLVEYKGGKCEMCGYSNSLRALSFHHKDPLTKEFGISGSKVFAYERMKREVDKCLLLCMNCHMELHEQLDKDTAV